MPADRRAVDGMLRSFGKSVARLRRERGLSQEELAWEVGIHTNHVSAIERGTANPSLAVVIVLAKVLNSSVSELLTPHAEKAPHSGT